MTYHEMDIEATLTVRGREYTVPLTIGGRLDGHWAEDVVITRHPDWDDVINVDDLIQDLVEDYHITGIDRDID